MLNQPLAAGARSSATEIVGLTVSTSRRVTLRVELLPALSVTVPECERSTPCPKVCEAGQPGAAMSDVASLQLNETVGAPVAPLNHPVTGSGVLSSEATIVGAVASRL